MTELAYLKDSYIKEFDAIVIDVVEGTKIVLDKTYFYVRGGGQLDDLGTMRCNDVNYIILEVIKKEGTVFHVVNKPGIKSGEYIHGTIDWDRRYKMMRMHTASHIVTGIIGTKLHAKITGHQLNLEKSRSDFNLEHYQKDQIIACIDDANAAIERDIVLETYEMDREQALKDPKMVKLANVLPPAIKVLRIVKIGDVDEQADGGTHVKSTKEIGKVVFLKAENRGKNNRRVYFSLE